MCSMTYLFILSRFKSLSKIIILIFIHKFKLWCRFSVIHIWNVPWGTLCSHAKWGTSIRDERHSAGSVTVFSLCLFDMLMHCKDQGQGSFHYVCIFLIVKLKMQLGLSVDTGWQRGTLRTRGDALARTSGILFNCINVHLR